MTNSELFELIIVMIEIGAFMLVLTLGAVILEVIVPKFMNIAVKTIVWLKNHKLSRRISGLLKTQGG